MSSSKKAVVYTHLSANYDLLMPSFTSKHVDQFVVFSDKLEHHCGWKTREQARVFDSDILSNRYHKFFPQKLFPNADISIYMDANIAIVSDIGDLIEEFINSNKAIALFQHRDRSTLEEEAAECLKMGKFDQEDAAKYKEQLERMYTAGMPKNVPLADNGIIFRRHDHPLLEAAMESWWKEFCEFTKRDQLCLPFVVWKNQLPIHLWNWSFRTPNRYFIKHPHRAGFSRDIRILLRHYSRLARNKLGFNVPRYSVIE